MFGQARTYGLIQSGLMFGQARTYGFIILTMSKRPAANRLRPVGAATRLPASDPWDGVALSLLVAREFPCKPQWRIDPHRIDYTGLSMITAGHGFFQLDGERYDCSRGCVFNVRPGTESTAGHDPADPITVISLLFNLSAPMQADASSLLPLPTCMRLEEADTARIELAMLGVAEAFASRAASDRLAARGRLLSLLAQVMALAEALPADRKLFNVRAAGRQDPRIAAVCEYVDEHLDQALGLPDLAAVAHLSPAHFASVFRGAVGQSPMAYLRRRRVDAARALLAQKDMTVEAAARAVGFDDPYHFSRVFRQVVGMPPSRYAASIRRPWFS